MDEEKTTEKKIVKRDVLSLVFWTVSFIFSTLMVLIVGLDGSDPEISIVVLIILMAVSLVKMAMVWNEMHVKYWS